MNDFSMARSYLRSISTSRTLSRNSAVSYAARFASFPYFDQPQTNSSGFSSGA